MARVFLSNTADVKVIYSVDQPVGKGGDNKRDDVLLVQFFLKVISESPGKESFKPTGKPALATDGIWGSTSQAYLDQFLLETNRRNPGAKPVKVDARVDPMTGPTLSSNKGGTEFSVAAMQATCKSLMGVAVLNDITTHPKFPAALFQSLKKLN